MTRRSSVIEGAIVEAMPLSGKFIVEHQGGVVHPLAGLCPPGRDRRNNTIFEVDPAMLDPPTQ